MEKEKEMERPINVGNRKKSDKDADGVERCTFLTFWFPQPKLKRYLPVLGVGQNNVSIGYKMRRSTRIFDHKKVFKNWIKKKLMPHLTQCTRG